MSDDEIPPAPAFCRRFTPEQAKIITQQTTKDDLVALGTKIQSEISKFSESDKLVKLTELNKNVSMAGTLNEYFSLDKVGQKARMLDLFTEIESLKTKTERLSSALDEIKNKYVSEKEDREELSDQCDAYIEEIDEKDVEITKLQIVNKDLSKRLSKTKMRFLFTLVLIVSYFTRLFWEFS